MAPKRALIVDDSNSARVILSRMLEKYDLEVDMAESAELAIEYLKHNRPDAIFMDHLMPGMDGLQAVQAIKSNPQTAMIPIMMYTSQEGELYVGQARALGAMGVLPKQLRPVDVSKVLYELHLLPDRRGAPQPDVTGGDLEATGGFSALHSLAAAPATSVDWGRRVEMTVKDQAADLRRFFIASLDSVAARIVNDVRDSDARGVVVAHKPASTAPLALPAAASVPAPVHSSGPAFVPPPPQAYESPGPWIAGIATIALIAVAFALLWIEARDELAKSRADVAALTASNAEISRGRQILGETVKDLTSALAATPPANTSAQSSSAASNAALARSELVPYGEVPLDRNRTDVLREFFGKLEAQGFHGVVKISSAAGSFCLTGNPGDGFVPANASLPASKCDLIGNPAEESTAGQQRQSLAFANLVAGIRQKSGGAISVSIESTPSGARPAAPYPLRTDTLTAGEWNKAAATNNRVDFTAEPAPP